jgi:four helix bundle protein
MENKIQNFYDLDAWKMAHLLALDIYKISENFSNRERYGITDQLRRAGSSVSANIAEGFERYHFKDKIRFYYQARGSVAEVQNFLLLAKDLNMISMDICKDLGEKANNVRQSINGLVRSIENNF